MSHWIKRVVALSALMFGCLSQAATTLSGAVTADDSLRVYVSNSLDPASFQLVYDKTSSWGTTGTFAGFSLPTSAQPLYLLVQATNNSGPAMFLGEFSLSGDDYLFGNGSNLLFSDAQNWLVGEQDFANAAATPFSMGQNLAGLPIWGQRSGISAEAFAIWAYNADWSNGRAGSVYFVTQLMPVPEPASWALFALGAALLSRRSLRRAR